MRKNWNTRVELLDDTVIKTTERTYTLEDAKRLAAQTIAYTNQLSGTPLSPPTLQYVDITGNNAGYRLVLGSERNFDANLQSLEGDDRIKALHTTLQAISDSPVNPANQSQLQLPIDSAGPNFHINTSAATATLVDTFPPLLRNHSGDINLDFIPYAGLPGRRKYIEFYRGTRVGAIIKTMSTVALGYSPISQIVATKHSCEYLHDLVPAGLAQSETNYLHRAIGRGLRAHTLAMAASDGACFAAKMSHIKKLQN